MKQNNYAKINLALNVTNKSKPSSLHNLEMVNVTISLKDSVCIKFINDNKNEIIITCNNINVPLDNSNLVYQVVEKFKKNYNLSFSCNIHINKKIPVNAGLAGGSGNACATLNILNRKFKTKMNNLQKMKFLQSITSDGPYMVLSSPCKIKDTYNHISLIKYNLKKKIFIVKPKSGCLTKDVFSSLDYKNLRRININKVVDSIQENNFDVFSKHIDNSLIDSACLLNEDVKETLKRLKACHFEVVSMSGSGSTCFAMSNKVFPYRKAKQIFNKTNYELCGVYKIKTK